MRDCLDSIVEGQGARARVILVLGECIWNVPAVSLVLPAFDDTGSLGFPPPQVVYPTGFTLVDCLRLLAGNREAELKPIFSSLLLLRHLLPFLF